MRGKFLGERLAGEGREREGKGMQDGEIWRGDDTGERWSYDTLLRMLELYMELDVLVESRASWEYWHTGTWLQEVDTNTASKLIARASARTQHSRCPYMDDGIRADMDLFQETREQFRKSPDSRSHSTMKKSYQKLSEYCHVSLASIVSASSKWQLSSSPNYPYTCQPEA
jgi:hypothetical protein